MSEPPVNNQTRWALIAMESVAIFPALAGLLGGDLHAGTLRAALLTVLLAAACFVAPRLGWLRAGWWQIAMGFALASGINLVLTAPDALSGGTGFTQVAGWVVDTIPPAVLGGAAWWRGLVVADAEMSREEIRAEFIAVGGALMILMMLFRATLGLSDGTLLAVVGLFLGCGLAAVALARQDAAGLERASGRTGLAVGLAVVPIALALGLVTVLQPGVVAAAASQLYLLVEVLIAILAFLLQPLVGLFAAWHPDLQSVPVRPLTGVGDLSQLERPELPEWLVLIAIGLAILLALLAAAFLLWALATTILPALFSGRGRTAAPDELEAEGDLGDDARALANGLGLWLTGLLHWAEHRSRHEPGGLGDARAVYRALLRWAQREGLDREDSETPRQFRQRLSAAYPEDEPVFQELTTSYESQRYGERPVPADELASLVHQLYALLGKPKN